MEKPVRDILDDFAARAPTPAAGSAAALSLTQGAALGLKVVRFANTPHSDPSAKATLNAAEDVLLRVIAQGIPKFEEDCRAVRKLIEHFKASRAASPSSGKKPPKSALPNSGLEAALQVPFAILSLARDGTGALESVMGITKKALMCEAGASASQMWAAAEISYWIVRNNADWLRGHKDWGSVLESAIEARDAARHSYESVYGVVSKTVAG